VTSARPGTSMSFSQSTYGRQRAGTRSRPATAMGDHAAESDGGQGQQQPNGTKFSPSSLASLRRHRIRTSISFESFASHTQRSRDVSGLNKSMSKLSLSDAAKKVADGGQVTTKRERQIVLPQRSVDVKVETVVGRPGQREQAAGHYIRPANPLWPKTPTRTKDGPQPETPCPKRTDEAVQLQVDRLETAIKSARKPLASPMKSPSPTKLSFLTKDSNLTSFTGWDVDERLDGIESQFKVMKEAMATSLTDRKTMEEAVEMAKTRGRFPSLGFMSRCLRRVK